MIKIDFKTRSLINNSKEKTIRNTAVSISLIVFLFLSGWGLLTDNILIFACSWGLIYLLFRHELYKSLDEDKRHLKKE